MRNKEHGCAVFATQIFDQFDNGGLNGHVKRGGRLIKNEERWLGHQRHRDHDTLLLPTRELVREGFQNPLRVGQFYIIDHFEGALIGGLFADALVDHRHFHQLLADLHRRVKRGHRLLVDHRDFIAANIAQLVSAHLAQIAAFELDRAANDFTVFTQILHDAKRHSGFATARLANKADCLARLD